MERRLLFAIVLMVAILVVPSLFLKSSPRRPLARADSGATRAQPAAAEPEVAPPVAAPSLAAPARVALAEDTTTLTTAHAAYRFSSIGATLEQATLSAYRSFHRGDRGPVRLVRPDDRLLAHRLVVGNDTVRLDSVPFVIEQQGGTVRMSGRAGAVTEHVTYSTVAGNPYLLDVRGEVEGLDGRGALLLVGLGNGFANVEADSGDNYRRYAVAVRRSGPENYNFRSVDSGVVKEVPGPFDWVAVKSKYFIGALLSADSARPQFGGAVLVGGPRSARTATRMATWVTLPVGPEARFRYQLYVGPQEHRAVSPLGRQLDRASPYGWIFKPIVMPVATWITQAFVWMHENVGLAYGWVLVFFGVVVRLVLWPLNQRAMKSQVAMMAVQPILQDIQKRYKNDPQKLQQETMRTYREHHVNPFGGCLPLLLPMPILLALFFVFANTIELRGTPFLWLPDLSLRDPLLITPLVMGLSMFALSKLSQIGMPKNPQTQMMTYFMPVMMTVLFLNFASGLNMYYAVSNLVSLPQQWLINKARREEMARRQVAPRGASS
jgi:YidC/Oxa1 family membrane protein insertase